MSCQCTNCVRQDCLAPCFASERSTANHLRCTRSWGTANRLTKTCATLSERTQATRRRLRSGESSGAPAVPKAMQKGLATWRLICARRMTSALTRCAHHRLGFQRSPLRSCGCFHPEQPNIPNNVHDTDFLPRIGVRRHDTLCEEFRQGLVFAAGSRSRRQRLSRTQPIAIALTVHAVYGIGNVIPNADDLSRSPPARCARAHARGCRSKHATLSVSHTQRRINSIVMFFAGHNGARVYRSAARDRAVPE